MSESYSPTPSSANRESLHRKLRVPTQTNSSESLRDSVEAGFTNSVHRRLRLPERELDAENARLREENNKLKEENDRLREENERLKNQTPQASPTQQRTNEDDIGLPPFLQRRTEARTQQTRPQRAQETPPATTQENAGLEGAGMAEPAPEPISPETEQQMAEKRGELEQFIDSLEADFDKFQLTSNYNKLYSLGSKIAEANSAQENSNFVYETSSKISTLIREAGLRPDDPLVQRIESHLDSGYAYDEYNGIRNYIRESFGSKYNEALPWPNPTAEAEWKAQIKEIAESRRLEDVPDYTQNLAEMLKRISDYKISHPELDKVSIEDMIRELNPTAFERKPDQIYFSNPTTDEIQYLSTTIYNSRLALNDPQVNELKSLVSEADWENIQRRVFSNFTSYMPVELGVSENEKNLILDWYNSLPAAARQADEYYINDFLRRAGIDIQALSIPPQEPESTPTPAAPAASVPEASEWSRFSRAISGRSEPPSTPVPPPAEPDQGFQGVLTDSRGLLSRDAQPSTPLPNEENNWSRFARALSAREPSEPIAPYKVEITNPEGLEGQVNEALATAPIGRVEFEMSPELLRSVLQAIPAVSGKIKSFEVQTIDDPNSSDKILQLKGDLGDWKGGVKFDGLQITGYGAGLKVLNPESIGYYRGGHIMKGKIQEMFANLNSEILRELQKRITVHGSNVESFTIRGDKLVLGINKL